MMFHLTKQLRLAKPLQTKTTSSIFNLTPLTCYSMSTTTAQKKILRPKSTNKMFRPSTKEPGKFVFDAGAIQGTTTESDDESFLSSSFWHSKIAIISCLLIATTILGYFTLKREYICLTESEIIEKHKGRNDSQSIINKHITILKIINALQNNLNDVILIDTKIENINKKKRINKMIEIDNEIKLMIKNGLFDEINDKQIINEYKNKKLNDLNSLTNKFTELGLNCYRPADQLELINQDMIRNIHFNLSQYFDNITKIRISIMPPFDFYTFGKHSFIRDVEVWSDKYKEYIRVACAFSANRYDIEEVNLVRIDLGNFRFHCRPWIDDNGIANISENKWIIEVQQKFIATSMNWIRHRAVNTVKRLRCWVNPKEYTIWVNLDEYNNYNYGKLNKIDIKNEEKLNNIKKKGLWKRWKEYWGITDEFEARTKGKLLMRREDIYDDNKSKEDYNDLDQESVNALDEFKKKRKLNEINQDNTSVE